MISKIFLVAILVFFHSVDRSGSISIGEFMSVPDGFVDKSKMNAWNLKSFASLSKEESEKRFEDTNG